ncbi:MAG: MBL fold metallo-hydrolase [Gemmatimonadales bacterium]|nr:MAG: MBL fold metallo-hydrolase [Gemmatimonadales bacterium]
MEPRVVRADNAGLFTLDGTRTHLLGRRRMVVIDPGPESAAHRDRLLSVLASGGAQEVRILVTHDHPDHAGGVASLADALAESGVDVRVRASPLSSLAERESLPFMPLEEGDEVPTDVGRLRALETPGHTRDHLAFHWSGGNALFAGDLLLGEGSTAWVGSYAGCVADYLQSLLRIETLQVRRILPAHGPPIDDPHEAIGRYREHRLRRIGQVREAVGSSPGATIGELVDRVYGPELPPGLRDGAAWSVRAILDHLGERPFPHDGPDGEG